MKNLSSFTLLSVLGLLLVAGCGIHENKLNPNMGQGNNVQLDPNLRVSYANVQQDLFIQSCKTCHLNGNHRGGVSLDTYAEVKSNLDDIQSDIADGSMPQGGSLSAHQIALFKQWVAQGSPEFATAQASPTATPDGGASPSPTVAPAPTIAPTPTVTPVPSATPSGPVLKISYLEVSSNVFQVSCKTCHMNGAHKGGVALDTYAEVKDHLDDIQSEVADGSMPPAGPMTDAQNNLLSQWIAQGAPENAEEAPKPDVKTPQPSLPDLTSPPVTPPPASALVPTYQSIREHVFVAKCIQCHAAGAKQSKRPLDTYASMMATDGLIVSGESEKSSVVRTIEAGKMPPKKSGLAPVTPEELAVIKLWINNGVAQ